VYATYYNSNVLLRNATGKTECGEFNTFVGTGYAIHYRRLTFGPIASLQYTYVGLSGFTEIGSLAPLRIESEESGPTWV
jgi:uncharacterized protein with beta-barrel porin domain